MSNKKSILQWCKEQHDAGKELTLRWEGGGDSGWCYFEIDGSQVENEYTTALVEHMYDVLDYGSWAGEFNASGEATYNPDTNSFVGTDYYGEDSHSTMDADVKISIPKELWFDQLHIECECYYDGGANVHVQFHVKNGFLLGEHAAYCEILEKELLEKFDNLFSNYQGPDEFRGCNESWFISRDEFRIEEDMLVYTMETIEIQTISEDDRPIVMELDEDMVQGIDQILNEENAEV